VIGSGRREYRSSHDAIGFLRMIGNHAGESIASSPIRQRSQEVGEQ